MKLYIVVHFIELHVGSPVSWVKLFIIQASLNFNWKTITFYAILNPEIFNYVLINYYQYYFLITTHSVFKFILLIY